MSDNNKELLEKLDALIALQTPKKKDPKEDAIAKAEDILRNSLKDYYKEDALKTWSLEQLTMAQDVVSNISIPLPFNKQDAAGEEHQEDEEEQTSEKMDAKPDSPFKNAALWYDKEVPI